MTLNYSEKVKEHFFHPKNVGEIKNASGVGEVGNPVCGDIMKVSIKVAKRKNNGKDEEYLKDVKFRTLGCAAAIATSSMVTEMAKGKTLKEAEKITNNDVAESLGSLPPIKMHCSNLAADALHEAIKNYKKKL